MLNKEITNKDFDELNDNLKVLYTQDGAENYKLGEDYYTDNSGLTSTLDKLKADKLDGQTELQSIQDKYAELEMKYAKRNGDKKEIDRLNQEKLDTQAQAHNQALINANKTIHDLTIGSTRDSIANEVFLNSEAWKMTDMEDRIKVDDNNKTYLTNKLGETVDRVAFIEEMRADENLSFALKGNAGNGGASHNESTDAPTPTNDKGFVNMSPTEKAALIKRNLANYQR